MYMYVIHLTPHLFHTSHSVGGRDVRCEEVRRDTNIISTLTTWLLVVVWYQSLVGTSQTLSQSSLL